MGSMHFIHRVVLENTPVDNGHALWRRVILHHSRQRSSRTSIGAVIFHKLVKY